jgi:hypothetical protein
MQKGDNALGGFVGGPEASLLMLIVLWRDGDYERREIFICGDRSDRGKFILLLLKVNI